MRNQIDSGVPKSRGFLGKQIDSRVHQTRDDDGKENVSVVTKNRGFSGAGGVLPRARDVDHRSQSLWLKYAEMEMRNKFVNHARNVWDRATAILPRVDQFWYKYTFM